MNTFNDIQTVLYREEDLSYGIANNMVNAAHVNHITAVAYTDDYDLGIILDDYRKKFSSKEVLILKEFQGRKFQKCPGSPNVICCNYYLLNTCFNCLYDCTYCFLNSYLNSFGITQFVNLDDLGSLMLDHASKTGKITRIGTGEFTDSLMFDEITGIAQNLIHSVASNRTIFLEFKTKSSNVNHLLQIKNKGNTVLAWTLNTPDNIHLYEKNTAEIEDRINAAALAQRSGYFVAFHFDPIIIYNGWQEQYAHIFDTLSRMINPEGVVWISLGCFRYSPGFKDIIKHRFPGENLTTGEMFPGIDGKYRYLFNARSSIYSFFYDRLKTLFPETYIYFCMESRKMWKSVTGIDFSCSDELEESLCSSLERFL